jgi:glycosyltransferase involved in cell wall biosynthesis
LRILAADTDLIPHAGRQRAFFDIVAGLSARGHEIDVFFRTLGSLKDSLPDGCHPVQVPGFLERSKSVKEAWRFTRSVLTGLRSRYDLVCVNRPELSGFAVAVSTLKRIPSFCLLQDHRYGYSRRSRYVLRRVTRLVAVSSFIRNHYIHRVEVDPDRILVVHGGVDPAWYRPAHADTRAAARKELGLPVDSFVIAYAGRIDPTKGVDVLIQAFRLMGSLPDRSRLIIAGSPNLLPGTDEPRPEGLAYQAELKRMAPSDRCRWVGHRRDVRPVYHAADVAVLPSRLEESFPRAVLEPMACGIPALASAVGGTPEALQPRFGQFLFEREDAVGLSEKLSRLQDWREKKPQLGMACREHVMERFTVDRTLDALERVFLDRTHHTVRRLPTR